MNRKNLVTLFAAVGLALLGASARAQTVADPNLYVAEYFNEDVFRFAPDGTGKTTFIAPFGTGQRFDQIAFAPSGDLYVAANNAGNIIHTFSPTGSSLGDFHASNPTANGVAVDSSGNVYGGSYGSSVSKYTASGTLLYTLAAGGAGSYNLTVDSSDNLYVSSYSNGTVRKFSSTGTDLGVFASGLGNSEGVAVDPFGNVYISSRSLSNVQKFNAAGSLLNTFTGFNDPIYLASDNLGNIYVTNYASGASGAGSVSKITFGGQNLGAITTGLSAPVGLAFRVPSVNGAAAPEPSSLALLVLPVLSVLVARRRTLTA